MLANFITFSMLIVIISIVLCKINLLFLITQLSYMNFICGLIKCYFFMTEKITVLIFVDFREVAEFFLLVDYPFLF